MQNVQLIRKIDSQGRLTVPKELRKILDLKPHDYVLIEVKKIEPEEETEDVEKEELLTHPQN